MAEHLERTIRRMSHAQLKEECIKQGFDVLVLNLAVSTDRSSLCRALIQKLLEPWEANTDSKETVDAWLQCTADLWPVGEERAQPNCSNVAELAQVLQPDGAWGLAACGAEVKQCTDAPQKGRGAFATRRILAGRVVGVYAGELLNQREHALRHAERGPLFLPPDEAEQAVLDERVQRLTRLSDADGAPTGGVGNHGGYAFALLPDVTSQQFPDRRAYVDAEDPTRSAWPRFVNHASERTHACNAEPKTDALRCLVWLEARRVIEVGEEICFDYGPLFDGAETGTANLVPAAAATARSSNPPDVQSAMAEHADVVIRVEPTSGSARPRVASRWSTRAGPMADSPSTPSCFSRGACILQ